jgi:hypothetical protein
MQFAAAMLLATALCTLAPATATADENSDLDFIPKGVGPNEAPPGEPSAPSPAAAPARGKLYLEDAFTASALRSDLVVPFPPPHPAGWENRSSLDGTDQWDLAANLTASLSDRFNVTEDDEVPFPTHDNLRNDFREGFLTWEPVPQSYLEGGRINLRNGVALGFSPTDFFKTRTQIDQASLDPSVIREDRLGTVMLRGQQIWSGGAASIAFAPKLYQPTAIPTGLQSGFDPRIDRTNAADRFLLSTSYDFAAISPQALVYREGTQTRIGFDVSTQIGQSIVAYAEWAGGSQPDLIDQAISYGKRTGTLHREDHGEPRISLSPGRILGRDAAQLVRRRQRRRGAEDRRRRRALVHPRLRRGPAAAADAPGGLRPRDLDRCLRRRPRSHRLQLRRPL